MVMSMSPTTVLCMWQASPSLPLRTRCAAILIARMYAKKLGIPYIGFYTQYPNERSYVINRISELMKV